MMFFLQPPSPFLLTFIQLAMHYGISQFSGLAVIPAFGKRLR